MTGRTHLVTGIAAGLLVCHLQPGADAAMLAMCAFAGGIGGLLPDIDHPRSILSGYVPGSGLARLIISHRGPTHTLWFVMAVAALLMALQLPAAMVAAAIAGMALHLVCDMATPQGVALLSPLSGRAWRLLPGAVLRVGGVAWAMETLTGAMALIGIAALLIIPARAQQQVCLNGLPCGPIPWQLPILPNLPSPTVFPTIVVTATPSPTAPFMGTAGPTLQPLPTSTIQIGGVQDAIATLEHMVNGTPIAVDGTGFNAQQLGSAAGQFFGTLKGVSTIHLGVLTPLLTFFVLAFVFVMVLQASGILFPLFMALFGLIRRLIQTILDFIPL